MQNKYAKKYYSKGLPKEKSRLRSKAYYKFRKEIIKVRKCCEICGSKENLELHHKVYINKPEYVRLLCRKCHYGLIKLGRKGKNL